MKGEPVTGTLEHKDLTYCSGDILFLHLRVEEVLKTILTHNGSSIPNSGMLCIHIAGHGITVAYYSSDHPTPVTGERKVCLQRLIAVHRAVLQEGEKKEESNGSGF